VSGASRPSTFYAEIARNRRESWLLVFVVAVVLACSAVSSVRRPASAGRASRSRWRWRP